MSHNNKWGKKLLSLFYKEAFTYIYACVDHSTALASPVSELYHSAFSVYTYNILPFMNCFPADLVTSSLNL